MGEGKARETGLNDERSKMKMITTMRDRTALFQRWMEKKKLRSNYHEFQEAMLCSTARQGVEMGESAG